MSNDSIKLSVDPRTITGKAVKHLRTAGRLPAVIHDHGKDSILVEGDAVQMLKVWKQAGKHHPVELKAGDQNFVVLIKTADFDPKKHQLTHLVFNAVDKNQMVDAQVPIQPRYAEGNESSPAERSGLIVLTQLEAVAVKAVPSMIPDVLLYDAEKLVEIGDHATVADLIVPENVEIETDANHAVATVYEPSALAAANEAAAGDGEDVSAVESDTADSTEAAGQAAESMPGGKEQKEPKPTSVEAAKADKE